MQTAVTTRLEQIRSRLADRFLAFKPALEPLPVDGLDLRFFYATPQAMEWYRPLAPHLRAEFEWLAARIGGHPERLVDAGAYHGIYALVMGKAAAPGSPLAVVDPVASNTAVIEANLALNGLSGEVVRAAVTAQDGPVSFTADSCGRIDTAGPVRIDGRRLSGILPGATVVKLDIEGAEGSVLPAEIDAMDSVHTWVVELHPDLGVDATRMIGLFVERGYTLECLDRKSARVVPFSPDTPWVGRSSLMATRPR